MIKQSYACITLNNAKTIFFILHIIKDSLKSFPYLLFLTFTRFFNEIIIEKVRIFRPENRNGMFKSRGRRYYKFPNTVTSSQIIN